MWHRGIRPLLVGAAATATVAAATVLPVSAGLPPGYTVPEGVEVVEVVVLGARGGNAGSLVFQQGGAGCQVTASLPVDAGDSLTWVPGSPGGDTDTVSADAPGGSGGAGSRPGGEGGAIVQFAGPATPGAGGGGASSLSVNGVELVVAGAGGGGSAATGGGSACEGSTDAGGNGFGSSPVAGGGITPAVGGVAGLGNGGSATPPPGTAGNSAFDSPAGKGGTGGEGRVGGPGGGGGGGGVSGGGGGAGQSGQFGGGNGTGAAGLSSGPEVGVGIAGPRFAPGERTEGSITVREVEVATSSLPAGTAGTAYSATLDASLVAATDAPGFAWSEVAPTALGDLVSWSLDGGSAPLPAGLVLDPTGSISGTPTASGTTEVTLAASVLNDAGDTRARSVVDLTIEVAGTAPTTTEAPTTTSEVTTTTAAGGGGSRTLPATGASSVAPLITAGVLLLGSGAGAAMLARRRRG